MAVHVTRCPHCQTSFRVRDEHLSVAKGMVRCGSCLQVFKAAEHFIDEPSAPKAAVIKPVPGQTATPLKKPAPVKPVQKKPKPDDDDEFGLIHDDMDDDPIPDKLVDDPFVDFNLRAPDSHPRPKPREEIELDESIFSLRNASSSTLEFIDDDDDEEDDRGRRKRKKDDESWADALLDDDDDGKAKAGSNGLILDEHSEFNFDLPPPEDDDFRGFIDDDDEPVKKPRTDSMTLGGGDSILETETLEISIPAASVARLQEEPLQLEKRKQRHGPPFPWGWFSASVAMLLIAGAQVLYFHFDSWAREPQWRPWYGEICKISGCSLPVIQNVNEIAANNLVVRSHPELQGALIADFLLLNKADYQQPFPDLMLVFADLNDNIVASRRFTPDQYLAGELAGQTEMPVQTPIHVALEIVDPGAEAVSWNIRPLANQ